MCLDVENALTVYCGGLPRALEILIDRLKVMNLDPNTVELSSLLEYIVDRITVRYHVSDLPCIESAVYMALYGKGVNLSDVVAGTMTVSDLFVCGYFVGSFGRVQSLVLPKMCPVMLHAWVLQMCKCDVKTSKAYHMAVCLFNMLQNMIVATGDSFEYVVAYHAVVMRYVYAAAMANKFPRLDEINWCSATLSDVYPIGFMWISSPKLANTSIMKMKIDFTQLLYRDNASSAYIQMKDNPLGLPINRLIPNALYVPSSGSQKGYDILQTITAAADGVGPVIIGIAQEVKLSLLDSSTKVNVTKDVLGKANNSRAIYWKVDGGLTDDRVLFVGFFHHESHDTTRPELSASPSICVFNRRGVQNIFGTTVCSLFDMAMCLDRTNQRGQKRSASEAGMLLCCDLVIYVFYCTDS